MSVSAQSNPALSDRTRTIGIAAAIGAISAVGMSLSLGLPLLAIVLEQRGLSTSAIGLNTAMAGLASIIVTPLTPRLVRLFGAAPLLAASLVVATLTFPLFYVFEQFWVWFLLRFVFHGAINVAFIVSEYWINALAPDGRRGLMMGIYATALSLGFAVGPAILAVVGSSGILPFLIGTVVMSLSLVPVLLALTASSPVDHSPNQRPFWRYLILVPLATFAALTMGATELGVMSFIAIYGVKIGFNEANAALLVSAIAIGNVVSQIPLGMISDRMDRRLLLLIIAAIGTVLVAIVPLFAHSLVPLFLILAAWGGVVAGLYTVGLTHLGARLSARTWRRPTPPSSSCTRSACWLAPVTCARRGHGSLGAARVDGRGRDLPCRLHDPCGRPLSSIPAPVLTGAGIRNAVAS